jgi:hypothetical protein
MADSDMKSQLAADPKTQPAGPDVAADLGSG